MGSLYIWVTSELVRNWGRKKMIQNYHTFQRLPFALFLHTAQREFVAVLLWVIYCLTSCLLIIGTWGGCGQSSYFTSSSSERPQNFIQDRGRGSHLQEGTFAATKLSHNFQFSSVTDEESHTSLPFGLDLNTQKWGTGKGPRTACPEGKSECLEHHPSTPRPVYTILLDGPPSPVLVIDTILQLVL